MPREPSEGERGMMFHLGVLKIPFAREIEFAPPRLFRADFIISRGDGARLIVEVQGGSWSRGRHARGGGMAEDGEKSAHAAIAGFFWMAVTTEQACSGEAAEWVQRWLNRSFSGCGQNDTAKSDK